MIVLWLLETFCGTFEQDIPQSQRFGIVDFFLTFSVILLMRNSDEIPSGGQNSILFRWVLSHVLDLHQLTAPQKLAKICADDETEARRNGFLRNFNALYETFEDIDH